MNITTRKRRSRKGVKWINHFYSDWYRARLSFGGVIASTILMQGAAQVSAIHQTKAVTKEDKLKKAMAVAQAVINTQIAANKAVYQFVN